LPKEQRFFELFEQQAAVIKKGLDLENKENKGVRS
jgi:hypothetical protein